MASESYAYSAFLPTSDNNNNDHKPLTLFAHVDPAARALQQEREGQDPLAFLSGAQVTPLTPALGDDITGVDLSTCDSSARDQLALQVARRGVLVFRDQENFLTKDADWLRDWGRHFGRLHIQAVGAHPKDFPEMYLVYRSADANFNFESTNRISSIRWHSDISYELQPAGLTTLMLFAQPSTGGDTLFASTVTALRSLSPQFVSFLKTLKAVHSAVAHTQFSYSGNRGGFVRREPVETVHPVIRRHPVTGQEALYVNLHYTTKIVGLKVEESDAILNFLYDHVAKGNDFQLRVKWCPNTVVIWDNRVVVHSSVVDHNELRHGGRITAQAEKPIPALETLDLESL